MSEPLDWLLLGRYALLVALCDLIPVPLLDSWVANLLRRRLTRAQLAARGIELERPDVVTLGNAPSGGCVGCLLSVVVWPVKKLLRTIFIFFTIKGIADTVSEVVHRGLLLEEALDAGWVPGDAKVVRAAMDSALSKVDTRPVERTLMGTLREDRHELNEAIVETVRVGRARLRDHPAQALADAAESDGLGHGASTLSRAMTGALQTSGVLPELIAWFRAEMGHAPVLEPGMPGPVVPELVGEAEDEEPVPRQLEAVEDAVEVVTPAPGGEE